MPQPNCAKRLECVELAPALNDPRRSTAGASSTHSRRFATTGGPKILAACEQFRLLHFKGAKGRPGFTPTLALTPGVFASLRLCVITLPNDTKNQRIPGQI